MQALRKPTSDELMILDRLLSAEFPGREAIQEQLQNCLVRKLDKSGSLEIRPLAGEAAAVDKSVPVEGEARDLDGLTIHYLLHVSSGKAIELEVYKGDLSDVIRHPAAPEIEVLVYPP